MNRAQAVAERAALLDRVQFLDAVIESTKPAPKPDAPYGCQEYDTARMCRFDKRAISSKCDGCTRTTDREYLQAMGLWVDGVSHFITSSQGRKNAHVGDLAGSVGSETTGVSVMEWKDQYKHPLWQKKRLEALDDAGYMCKRCYDSETQLHVHHKQYVKGRMIWEYPVNELAVLCSDCHETAHDEKDIFSYMLRQIGPEGMQEIIQLVAGFCRKVHGPSIADMAGPISYFGETFSVMVGYKAAEIYNASSISDLSKEFKSEGGK